MVSATVEVSADSTVSLDITRLPSDLNYVRADYWDADINTNNQSLYPVGSLIFTQFRPYERFTLTDNPNSPTSHYIQPLTTYIEDADSGPGSGGNAISCLGDLMTATDQAFIEGIEYVGLTLLEQGFQPINVTNTSLVTRWMGQLGASYMLQTVSYNGWAAYQSPHTVKVVSTGGVLATCYRPWYALGFLPLVLAATVVIIWAFFLLVTFSLFGTQPLKEAYGGMAPYVGGIRPGGSLDSGSTLLVWEGSPQPHLEVADKAAPIEGDPHMTALQYLKLEKSLRPSA